MIAIDFVPTNESIEEYLEQLLITLAGCHLLDNDSLEMLEGKRLIILGLALDFIKMNNLILKHADNISDVWIGELIKLSTGRDIVCNSYFYLTVQWVMIHTVDYLVGKLSGMSIMFNEMTGSQDLITDRGLLFNLVSDDVRTVVGMNIIELTGRDI